MTIPELAQELTEAIQNADDDDYGLVIENILYTRLSSGNWDPDKWANLLVRASEYYGRMMASPDFDDECEVLGDAIDDCIKLRSPEVRQAAPPLLAADTSSLPGR